MGPFGVCLRVEDRVIVHKRNEISWRGALCKLRRWRSALYKGCFMRLMETAVRFTHWK
jgi:hypothetical protein